MRQLINAIFGCAQKGKDAATIVYLALHNLHSLPQAVPQQSQAISRWYPLVRPSQNTRAHPHAQAESAWNEVMGKLGIMQSPDFSLANFGSTPQLVRCMGQVCIPGGLSTQP